MYEVGEKTGLVGTRRNGQCNLHCLFPQAHFVDTLVSLSLLLPERRQASRQAQRAHHSQLLPFRMIESSAPTKSVKTASIWSSPASTAIMSELGFVYFFPSTTTRNVLKVCCEEV